MSQEHNPFADITTGQHSDADQRQEENEFSFFGNEEVPGFPQGAATGGNAGPVLDDPFQIPEGGDLFASTDDLFGQAGTTGDTPQQQDGSQDNELHMLDDELSLHQEPAPAGAEDAGSTADNVMTPAAVAPAATMTFSCRSCATPNDIGFAPEITEDFAIQCASCATRIRLVRESSAQRAAQTSRELYCVKCGHRLDHHVNCPTCGLYCPDYLVVEDPAAARRKARKQRLNGVRDILAGLGTALTWKPAQKVKQGYSPQRATHGRGIERKTVVKLVAGLALLAAVVAGGAFLYLQHKEEQAYVTTYVKTVYALKMVADNKLESLSRLAADWKAASDAGQTFVPRVDVKAEAKGAKIRDAASKLLQKLQKVPKKYEQAQARLDAMNTECLALYRLAEKPLTSLDQLTGAMEKSSKTYKQACQDLKANLPPKLSEELASAKTRYKGLADF